MLIPCDRITHKDREIWEELHSADHAWAKTSRFRRLIDSTHRIVEEFLVEPPRYYVAVSWGKDSVALAHVMHTSGCTAPMIWLKELPHYNPHCDDVSAAYISRFPAEYMIREYSFEGYDAQENSIAFRSVADEVNCEHGVRAMGLRKDESWKRLMRFKRWGHQSKNTFCPLSLWTARDIYAYLALYDLPIHPNYAMVGGGRYDRQHIRVDTIGGLHGDGIGRREWEREYYPEY